MHSHAGSPTNALLPSSPPKGRLGVCLCDHSCCCAAAGSACRRRRRDDRVAPLWRPTAAALCASLDKKVQVQALGCALDGAALYRDGRHVADGAGRNKILPCAVSDGKGRREEGYCSNVKDGGRGGLRRNCRPGAMLVLSRRAAMQSWRRCLLGSAAASRARPASSHAWQRGGSSFSGGFLPGASSLGGMAHCTRVRWPASAALLTARPSSPHVLHLQGPV